MDLGISDHTAQFIYIPVDKAFKERFWFIYKRNVKKNLVIFQKYISQVSFSEVFTINDANCAYDKFSEIFTLILNLCIPIERNRISYKKDNKWITKGLLISCKNKRIMYRNYRNAKCENYTNFYKRYCKILKNISKASKKLTNINYINNSDNKSKASWDIIRRNTSQSNNIRTTVDYIKINDDTIEEPHLIAEHMNNSFTHSNKINDPSSYTPTETRNPNSIFFTPVTEDEINTIVKKTKNSHSESFDGISSFMIKATISYISKPLVYLINLSLENGCFPDTLKQSLIKPLHKKGNKYNIDNYRPIALLSGISKIYEKVINNRTVTFINKNKILHPNQFGFQKN